MLDHSRLHTAHLCRRQRNLVSDSAVDTMHTGDNRSLKVSATEVYNVSMHLQKGVCYNNRNAQKVGLDQRLAGLGVTLKSLKVTEGSWGNKGLSLCRPVRTTKGQLWCLAASATT